MQFDQIKFEYKFGIVFSAVALVLSLATGFIAGISAGVVIVRGLVIAAVFFGMGFSVIMVVKRFVPEAYDVLSSPREPQTGEGEAAAGDAMPQVDEPYQEAGEEPPQFTEFTEKDFDRYNTPGDSGIESSPDVSGGKLGKHVLVEQQFSGYEPKLMAQAIKTMMSKDKD